ncbi:cysteine dioxygenase [Allostreptomyces psammosilenae]|uniref:Putative metal-dependent enzyme (Double-stranded beta helix superfamily) n=1 Tax=Allostreptomyces psammosilenae TaxID=1892865 RepID=A0A853A6Q1_9ACTN|nr:cysteine dioxygenase family protein [Allostreptomyces psammosilenae]NYI06152.1 putative metal-dependent enzyme (double-stranded beta helix superfamily) [Allostreptomyces psammosilenae]
MHPSQLSDISIAGDPLALADRAVPRGEHPGTLADLAAVAERLAAEPERWLPLLRFDPLTRWYTRLEAGPRHEAWLLSWLPGQGSGRHDHGASTGVFTVVQGVLTEYTGAPAGPAARAGRDAGRRLAPGRLRVAAPGTVHEVLNSELLPAASIHVYGPRLTEMNPHASLAGDRARTGTGAAFGVRDGARTRSAGAAAVPGRAAGAVGTC